MARKPSHLGSNSQPSPAGRSVASFASIGSIGGSIGKPAAASFLPISGRRASSDRETLMRRCMLAPRFASVYRVHEFRRELEHLFSPPPPVDDDMTFALR